jgi:hypothetical protein
MYSREVLICPMLESLLSDIRRSDLVAPFVKEAFYFPKDLFEAWLSLAQDG